MFSPSLERSAGGSNDSSEKICRRQGAVESFPWWWDGGVYPGVCRGLIRDNPLFCRGEGVFVSGLPRLLKPQTSA